MAHFQEQQPFADVHCAERARPVVLGLKGVERIGVSAWSLIFNAQTGFDPYSLQRANDPKSLVENNATVIDYQSANGDSSRAGQLFNTVAYVGISNRVLGAVTVGRQDSLVLDILGLYDAMAAAPAFFDEATKDGWIVVSIGPVSIGRSDSVWGGSDLYPTAQLYWNKGGVNNFMAYLTGDIPVGSYNPDRLANIGIGHGAIDGGGAYTYLNTKTGTEFSATLGLTGNFANPSTNYTNGIDSHLDLAASQFLNQQLFVGAVGYVYQQLTPDRGQRAILGPNESRTRGVGPQIGYNFNVGGTTIYTNLRAYWEFDSYRRLQGQAIYATMSVPLSGLLAGNARPQ